MSKNLLEQIFKTMAAYYSLEQSQKIKKGLAKKHATQEQQNLQKKD